MNTKSYIRPKMVETTTGKHPIQIPRARPLYRFAATGLGAAMWFFVMYRAKKEGAVLLGYRHPWDH